jgi:hypothetical protein
LPSLHPCPLCTLALSAPLPSLHPCPLCTLALSAGGAAGAALPLRRRAGHGTRRPGDPSQHTLTAGCTAGQVRDPFPAHTNGRVHGGPGERPLASTH